MATDDKTLIEAARTVQQQAWAKYSGYRVGAALVDENGRVHVGCNVENETYPLGNCAEVGAIAAMVAAGGRRIATLAVVGGDTDTTPCMPCGGCRQRIHEFADMNTRILAIDDSGQWQEYRDAELLPASFHMS